MPPGPPLRRRNHVELATHSGWATSQFAVLLAALTTEASCVPLPNPVGVFVAGRCPTNGNGLSCQELCAPPVCGNRCVPVEGLCLAGRGLYDPGTRRHTSVRDFGEDCGNGPRRYRYGARRRQSATAWASRSLPKSVMCTPSSLRQRSTPAASMTACRSSISTSSSPATDEAIAL